MSRYGPKAQKAIEDAMHEFGDGELKDSGGYKVTKRKQAVAIGMNKARAQGYKVPHEK